MKRRDLHTLRDVHAEADRVGDLEARLMLARSAMQEAVAMIAAGQLDLAAALLSHGVTAAKPADRR